MDKFGGYTKSFNWTKVELKHDFAFTYLMNIAAFNWTKVELKPTEQTVQISTSYSFNWTKVELKQI